MYRNLTFNEKKEPPENFLKLKNLKCVTLYVNLNTKNKEKQNMATKKKSPKSRFDCKSSIAKKNLAALYMLYSTFSSGGVLDPPPPSSPLTFSRSA